MTTIPTAPAGLGWQLARVTAPLTRAFAGRRFFPLWAVVHHRGRRTGRELAVPVAVQAPPGAFVIVLPWGPRTNWVQNVLAAGGCTVRHRGTDHRTKTPEILDRQAARQYFTGFRWAASQRVFGASTFLLLHRE